MSTSRPTDRLDRPAALLDNLRMAAVTTAAVAPGIELSGGNDTKRAPGYVIYALHLCLREFLARQGQLDDEENVRGQ